MRQILNGPWVLATDRRNAGKAEGWSRRVSPEAQAAPVPGIIQQVFPGYHGVAWYWHVFRLQTVVQPDERLLIRFGAVDYLGEVWLNGQYLGAREGGETPFEFDVTESVNGEGENLLAVRVLNPTNERIDGYVLQETPHRNKVVPGKPGSGFDSGGIMYPVELRRVPGVHIADVFIRPDAGSGQIAVEATIRNATSSATAGSIEITVAPATGGDELARLNARAGFAPGDSLHRMTVTVAQPRLWNLDDPYLYRVTVVVTLDQGQAHRQDVRCGFRDFRIVDGYFYLNGKRIFLKSTHTGNAQPIGLQVPVIADFIRRDLIYAKAAGFNAVRFIAGVAYPDQFDFCDEIGLLVWESTFAGWCLADSAHMAERYDRNTSEMVRRDRNHPSAAIWELLNETQDGPVFRHAVDFLPKLRALDPTRLVLLSSGRWDGDWTIGSASNPGGEVWEPVWGGEGPAAARPAEVDAPKNRGYVENAGDAHYYPHVPQSPEANARIRNLGRETKPVLLSEYGIGSLFDVVGEWRHFEQAGARADLEDAAAVRLQSERLMADWQRLGFGEVYPFPDDLLRESQRLHARQRTLGFDLIRSNPKLCGYNLTGMLDHGMTGEGLWTYWRQWKPMTFDAVADGWSSLRWCLFADPSHGYTGRPLTIEAVLANEGTLPPGDYPARFRILGPQGIAWEKAVTVTVPDPAPLAVPVLRETMILAGPTGQYTLAANLEGGGAPTGGRLTFYLSDSADVPRLKGEAWLWGIDDRAGSWLRARGLTCRPLDADANSSLVLVGKPPAPGADPGGWARLADRLAKGATLLFLSGDPFRDSPEALMWLPLANRGRCITFVDWLYYKECVVKRHPVFAGLPAPGIMDWDYWGPVIPHEMLEGQDTPQETIAAAFATGHHRCADGYGCGLLIAAHRAGGGRVVLSTPYLLENLDRHPAADRLLVNLISYAQEDL